MKTLAGYLRPLKMFPGFRELAALRAERQSRAFYEGLGVLDLQRRLLDAITFCMWLRHFPRAFQRMKTS